MIRASAPGKVVLWGEYAVLAGAPAVVMAVNRRAGCEITVDGSDWRFSARGHQAPAVAIDRDRLLASDPPDADALWAMAWHVLQSSGDAAAPAGADVLFDTDQFHQPGAGKLGLGSSAALCVAVCGAFGRLLGQPADFANALEIHTRLQGGHGSGIDVAAAWYGGLLKFQRHGRERAARTESWAWPAGLVSRFVFSGRSASTRRHLERLQVWRAGGGGRELEALGDASAAVLDDTDTMAALERYVAALRRLDEAAELGIFSAPHRHLAQLAMTAGVVYKPCGAGGGDIGVAFTADADAAARFDRLAADQGFLPLVLEIASHGIEVTG